MKTVAFSFVLILLTAYLANAQISGYFRVRNSGAYMARFRVEFEWYGQWLTYETDSFPAGKSRTIELPIGATRCNIYTDNLVFIAVWKGVFNLGFGSPVSKCFNIWGTTLHPGWGEENC